ncbi:M10 family metallopeptidase C-terminal domain-containing protein [Bradyrhizobium sediminis]|uniref:M10 family metallopeptidase C-terminal domain-containing protein n=1 Tax=Bradyrhizobium sediminis TaxID=2840469 RepID=A0A975NGT3_9BRAD|nr:M10 family metallopeptidase C-terminal domain-containing protein [Bradyrhizobium sediminis]QWG14867.1 M10 family metallopeptidase C-terminal domain-containing protein [Bradyrhizobium sediminis]
MATAVSVSSTGNPEIDGLLGGSRWTGTITYSFPDSPSDYPANYYGDGEPTTAGFASAPLAMQQAITYAFALIAGYTNATIQFAGTNGADIAIAQSPAANPTSYAYYPYNVPAGGDIWFGTGYDYSQARLGNYYFVTALHELGHALGLKHSQELGGVSNVAVPAAHDDSEYTVMSYRSYVGAPLTGYTAEAYGYPQTFMANDILALQTLYGADFTTHSENTVYSWSPTTGQEFINGVAQLAPGTGAGGSANRIFETVWDGNGVDTYDFSNYTTALTVNLNPGASSITSATQIAYLGNGHYASGNVYNAYLFNGDSRSYIDNAIGGSGNDSITGNAIANTLNGGAGNDTLIGGLGVDMLTGGSGADTFVFVTGDSSAVSGQHDRITDFVSGVDRIDLSGIDAISSTGGYDQFRFLGASAFDGAAGALNYSYDSSLGVTVLRGDANGDRVADFAIDISGNITLSAADLIGIVPTPVVIEALGSTSLVQIGGNFYLDSISGGTGPSLKYAGAAVVAGQFGAWAPIGAEQTASGYEVVWKNGGADQYTVWNTDSSGNPTSMTTGAMSGADYALQSLEPDFHQDLNGDGHIGLTTTVIEANGSTSLTGVGNEYFLFSSSGSGPSLKYAGAAVVAGQFGAWAPIGAEQTASGYEVVWKNGGADQYTVWNTDSSGNPTSMTTGAMSGADYALQSLEPDFHQDLNGDGHIGLTTTVIEANGSTSLTGVGNEYFLFSSSGSGPSLKYAGAAVVAGQFGAWAPIGAEQTASGYEVVWKNGGADQYTVWNTDSSGNPTSMTTGAMSGADYALQSLEPDFHQDLNGDGHIGLTTTVIEANGSTSLTGVGNEYFLFSSSGSGPSLKYAGAAVVAGQFGAWAPIGAEQTASGYEVVWKNGGADQYTVWNTDSSGNPTSMTTGAMSGADYALQSLEPDFHQDLNGDGHIGLTTTVIEANGSTSLTGVGNEYFLFSSSGSGPSLKYAGAAVVAGQFGAWAPIGAEQTASGYEVVWKNGGADQYTVWNTDSSGNPTSMTTGAMSGADYALQSLEPDFYQDLNGDGHIGLTTTVIETANHFSNWLI